MMKNQNKLHGENVIPAGYKRTEVGVIPNDWDEINLNSIVSELEAGVSVNSIDQVDAYSHGKHILKTSCVSNGHFDGYEKKSILPTDVKRAKCSPVKGGIVVSRMNTPALVGEVGYVAESNLDSFLPDRLWQMKFKKDVAHNPKWLATLLSFPPFSKKIKDTATGTSGSMKNISKSAFLSLKLPWPTLKEQNIIGTALSDADALITALEQLIAKKQAIKTATMQQLLTGRTRLPQFYKYSNETLKGYATGELGHIPVDWEVVTCGEIGKFRGGNGFPTGVQGQTSGKYPFYKVSDMNNDGNGIFMSDSNNWISSNIKKQLGSTIFPAGSIIFAKVGAAIFLERKKILTIPSCIDNNLAAFELDLTRCEIRFIHYILLNLNFGDYVSTTALPSLSGAVLSKIKIVLPSIKEQMAIASILSDMDAEIEMLEKKLAKFHDIKQGMMQQLLTGRIRLPLDHQP
ncbi:restriction endonuclease subunit S [Erwinia sp. SLM-02]|uniref:restriction endonuclease subunit S n=1 Tax=Erwinia sp. SLM-02 TaxID=3020057 RepID=UPI0030803667